MKQYVIVCLALLFSGSAWPVQSRINNTFGQEIDREVSGKRGKNNSVIKGKAQGKPASLAPSFFIALDMVFESGFKRSDRAPNQGKIREVEFGYSGNIDPWFFGVVSFVLENENGEYKADLHEAYIRWTGLGKGMALRAGKLFLEIGIMNTIHQHDRPFTDSPLVQREFFDYESAADFGLDFSWLMPFMPFYTKLNIGVFNGQVFGHSHSAGTPKPIPLVSGSLRFFFPLGGDLGLRLGCNGLIRPLDDSDAALHARYFGVDLMLKGWQTKDGGVTLQGEWWLRQRQDNGQRKIGLYLLSTVKLLSWLECGIRYDYLQTVAPVKVNPGKAYSLFLTFKPSEFSMLRLQYQRLDDTTMTEAENLLTGQISFILGAHPSHKF